MAFWADDFMTKRRKQWLDALVKFQYYSDGSWKDATVTKKEVTGNKIVIIVSFPRTTTEAETITGIRIIDVTGQQCGYSAANLQRRAGQGALTKFEFPIYEKAGE